MRWMQAGAGEYTPLQDDGPDDLARGPLQSTPAGLEVVEDFKFWEKVYAGVLPEDLSDMIRRRTGQAHSAIWSAARKMFYLRWSVSGKLPAAQCES